MIYFDTVNKLRNEVKINPLIELVPVVRSYSENGWSNPKKIVNRVIQNIKENESGRISYETILNWIMEYFEDEKYIVASELRELEQYTRMYYDLSINIEGIDTIHH